MTDPTIIFETFLAPTWYKTFLYITEYVERFVSVPTFLLHGEALEDFATGDADAGFINTSASIQLLGCSPCPIELIAAPLLQGEDTHPPLIDIVVRKASCLKAVSDLHGCIWASCRQQSHVEDDTAYESALSTLDFADTIEATSQAQSLRLLLDGKADAAAIDARVMDIVLHNSPHMATQLSVLDTYCASPGPLIAIGTHISPLLKQKIQEAFLTMHQHPFYAQRLQECAIERFIPVTSQYYQRTRKRYWNIPISPHFEKHEVQRYVSANSV